MKKISIIGLDLAKRVLQVHGVDEQGNVVVQKQLQRSGLLTWFSQLEPCLVGIEACATAHYWSREIQRLGHDVRLMPPAYVKAYVRRQKNDRADAAAICEAVSRPSMRFAGTKTIGQQTVQVLHRSRELLIKQRVQLSNALRAHLAEFGWIFPQGRVGLDKAIDLVKGPHDADLPGALWDVLLCQVEQLARLRIAIANLNKQMVAWHRADGDSKRLATIPGVGVVTASAILASIGDGKQFKSGREFAAWVGLVPRQKSSGGKEKLGHLQAGQSLPAPALGRRRYGLSAGQTLRESRWRQCLVQPAVASQTRKSGVGCARQQDGAYHLGSPHYGRVLPFPGGGLDVNRLH